MHIILGIDPGSIHLGYSVLAVNERHEIGVLDFGVIENPKLSSVERLGLIHKEINDLLLKYQPQSAAIEKVFLGKNPQSVFRLGLARGAALAALGTHKVQVHEFSPKAMKKYVTGSGLANKESVLIAVQRLLQINADIRYDAADAIGLAYVLARQVIGQQMGNQFVIK